MRFCLSIRGAINIDKSILAGKPIRKLNEIIIKSSTKTPLAVADGTSSIKSFTQLRLREEVITALQSINITHPTAIQVSYHVSTCDNVKHQMLAIPQILKGKNVLCAGETGSGKTLAYLLPLVNRLKDEEINHGLMTRLRKPRAVVIVPTRDLANQVLLTIKSISHVVKLRCIGLIGGRKRKFIKEALLKPVDVIVATPYSLLRFSREERLSFGDVSHLVIDEADTMFEDTFEEPLTHILKFTKIRTAKPKTSSELGKDAQVTFVSATLSNKMMTALNQKIPNLKTISSKQLHKILPNIEQRFVKVSSSEKSTLLLKLLKEKPDVYTIVFCNTVPSCDWTEKYLTSHGIQLVKLHGGINALSRQTLLKEFIKGKSKVLICTDIGSRGIDCSKVAQIIQFDWPNSLEDYLHRVGRTGRVGMSQKCRSVSFMTRRRDVRMAWMIKDSADKNETFMNKDTELSTTTYPNKGKHHLINTKSVISGAKNEKRFDAKIKDRKTLRKRKLALNKDTGKERKERKELKNKNKLKLIKNRKKN